MATCSKSIVPETASQPVVATNPDESSSSSENAECGFISDDATSQSDEEDLFADVFTSQDNYLKLSDILQNSTQNAAISTKTQDSATEVVSISLDDIKNGSAVKEEEDIFADCFVEEVLFDNFWKIMECYAKDLKIDHLKTGNIFLTLARLRRASF